MPRTALRDVVIGPVITVPTPFGASGAVDSGALRELTEWYISQGAMEGRTCLKVAAAMGEGPSMSRDERLEAIRMVVEVSGGRTPVLGAIGPLDTRRAMEEIKLIEAAGAIGAQVELPVFHHPTADDLVRHSEAIGGATDLGIVVYNTWWFNGSTSQPSLDAETILRIADADWFVALKWSVPPGMDYETMKSFAAMINVLDNDNDPVRCHRLGGRGWTAILQVVNPKCALSMWDMLERGDYVGAEERYARVWPTLAALNERMNQRSGGYRMVKGILEELGHSVGSTRPPSLALDGMERRDIRAVLTTLGWT